MHAIDHFHDALPCFTPRFNGRARRGVGTADKSIEQLLLGNVLFGNATKTHTDVSSVDAAGFCIPGHHGVEFLSVVEFSLKIGFYTLTIGYKMLSTHIVLETGFINVEQPRLWIGQQLIGHKRFNTL